jgi:hypothetical protein
VGRGYHIDLDRDIYIKAFFQIENREEVYKIISEIWQIDGC